MAAFKGITRVRRNGREVEGSVYLARLTVPVDVRRMAEALPDADPRRALFIGPNGKAKVELLETTGHVDPRDAARVAEPIITRWKVAVTGLRQGGTPEGVAAALDRIDQWQTDEVARAQGFEVEAALHEYSARLRPGGAADTPAPGVEVGGVAWANAYFTSRPDASREAEMPASVFRLLDRLDACENGSERWRDVEGFDAHLEREIGALDPKVKASIRLAFARAWRAVVAAQEVERRHAAMLLKIVGEARSAAVTLPHAAGYEPRRGDRTVGELLDAYQAAKPSKDAVAPARAVREFIGAKTPVRAVGRDDARRFKNFVVRIPANATKFYPKLSMVEAADRAEVDRAAGGRRPVLSPTSAARYMTYASMFWNWGIEEGEHLWADENPFKGLAEKGDAASTQRRSFKDAELVQVFNYLGRFKNENSYKFWVPALLLNGARLSEICQLRTDDVRDFEGTPYLDIGLFDAAGCRDEMKTVKTPESIRAAPIHPLAIKAGFIDFVKRRQAADAERLFGDAKPYWNKKDKEWDWSHYQSRVLNKAIDDAVTDDPALVIHSLRHGFRERAERADVAPAVIDSIAGWAQKSVGRKYGDRDVPLLAKNLARVDYGGLKL